jgi:hypothetical protein
MDAVTPDDLATYLGTTISSADEDRAQMLIDDATAQALSVVTVGTVPTTGATAANLPVGAESVIRAAVARLFLNPMGVSQEVTGPYTFSRPAGSGSMFSKAEIATLRRLAGRSGAFSVALLPADYPESAFSDSSSSS